MARRIAQPRDRRLPGDPARLTPRHALNEATLPGPGRLSQGQGCTATSEIAAARARHPGTGVYVAASRLPASTVTGSPR